MLEMMAPHLALIIDRTEWARKAETFQQMSLTDPLTGLPNRRYLQDRLFEEVERSKRYNTPLSFMIIDVDRFKVYNDVYGHTNADRVLVTTAQLLRSSIRASICRQGLPEMSFALSFPNRTRRCCAHRRASSKSYLRNRIPDRARAGDGRGDYQHRNLFV